MFGVVLVHIFRIRTEYGEILRISSYSVRMRENKDQNNAEYEHFLGSAMWRTCSFQTKTTRANQLTRFYKIGIWVLALNG